MQEIVNTYLYRYWHPSVIAVGCIIYLGEGNGTPLQYSCLENPMDWGAWWAAVHGVPKSQTWLSDFTFTFHFHALEEEMATHSSVLAWRIPGMWAAVHGVTQSQTRLKWLSSSIIYLHFFSFPPFLSLLLQKYPPWTHCLGPNFMTYWQQWSVRKNNSMSPSTCDLKRHSKFMPAFRSSFPWPGDAIQLAPESHCFFSLGTGMKILELTWAHPEA